MQHLQMKHLKSLIVWIYLFCCRENVHGKIHVLLSLRYGLSPGAKERGGDVAITSPFFLPRRFFVVVMSACRSFRSLLPSFFMPCGALHRRNRFHPDIVADFIPVESPSMKGSSRRRRGFSQVVESIGDVAEELFDRTATRVMRCGAENDRKRGMVRRRRGRRLLMVPELLLLLCRLLRCFLCCHEHSTSLQFQKL